MRQNLYAARRLIVVALLALFATTCRDAGPEPPGPLDLRLLSPNGAEGSALVRVEGDVARVEAMAPGWLLTDVLGDTLWVLVARDAPGELGFRVHLRAGGRLDGARLLEVAGPDNTLRSDTTGYRLEIR